MDPNINLPEVLRLHAQYLSGDPAGKRAVLPYADLRHADLRHADLRDANLRWADLRWADLEGTDLTGADLEGADLEGADLEGADLRHADLEGADLEGAVGLPIVADAHKRLQAVAAAVLANPDSLYMGAWHSPCGTTHCLAGWAIHQAGPLGQVLEQLQGPALAGRLLLGHEAANQFYRSNDEVLDWLRSIAAE